MLDIVEGFAFTGSVGDPYTFNQPSSHVGKTTLAKALVDEGCVWVSLADEIRKIVHKNPMFGDIDERQVRSPIIETLEQKQSLIAVGEGVNKDLPYGWVSLAMLKALYRVSTSLGNRVLFVVDDCRRPEEALLMGYLGMNIIEVARTDGNVKQYDCDGRLTAISPITVRNDGGESFIPMAVAEIMEYPTQVAQPKMSKKSLLGAVRLIAQCQPPEVRNSFMETSGYKNFFGDTLKDLHSADPSAGLAIMFLFSQAVTALYGCISDYVEYLAEPIVSSLEN